MHDAKVIEELEALRLPELQARFKEVVGEESRSPNKTYLIRKIVDRMAVAEALERHALAEGTGGTEPEGTSSETTAAAGEPERPPEFADNPPKTQATAESAATPESPADAAPEKGTPAEPAPARKPRRKKAEETDGDAGEPKLSKLDIPALQAMYRELIGRDTSSTSKRYLVWRCQQAQKGRIPTGPLAGRRSGEKIDAKVLPMRVPTAAIEPLDEVWRKLGLRSRNEMFRNAMAAFLVNAGESDLAIQFGASFSDESSANAE